MSISEVQTIEGFRFEIMSDSPNFSEPCIVIPVSTAKLLGGVSFNRVIRALIREAYFMGALNTADWILINSRNAGSKSYGKMPLDIIESHSADIEMLRSYAGKDEKIDEAIKVVDFSLEAARIAAELNATKRARGRTQVQKVRSELQANYHKTLVSLGRRDGFRCMTCLSSEPDLQIDHVVPVSKGGKNDLDNLQLLCRTCNAKKSDKFDGTEKANYG